MPYLKPIKEATYLTTQDAEIYRCIMRIFYEEHERMHYQLYKEDLMVILKQNYQEVFSEYSMDKLKSDLESLTEWKNLVAFQDPKKVYTIAEYKNKQYWYSMSETAVEIERMALRLENLLLEPASLSTNYFVRISQALEEIKGFDGFDNKKRSEWWRTLQEDFQCMNQNYQDYLREFYSGKAEKVLKSVEFILHKDKFVEYLRDFIQELQQHSSSIAMQLKRLSSEVIEKILTGVIKAELDIPRTTLDERQDLAEVLEKTIRGRWKSLAEWFLPVDGIPSRSSHVLDITNGIIQKIIQNANLIVQLQNLGLSRRAEYLHFIKLFRNCASMDEAHCLAANIFGVQHIRHFIAGEERATDRISSGVLDEEAEDVLLVPHIRQYRPRTEKTGFSTKALEKEVQRQEYLARVQREKKKTLQFINGNRLKISEIKEEVSSEFRMALLRWITAANMNENKKSYTEFGQTFFLQGGEKETVLRCEDGDLIMPDYELTFEGAIE